MNEKEYHRIQALDRQRKEAARKRRIKQEITILAVLLGIVLLIFTLGTWFGWHLGTAHTVRAAEQIEMPEETKANVVDAQLPVIDLCSSTEPEPDTTTTLILRDDIVCGNNRLSYELQEMMQFYCRKYGVPYAFALAVAEKESSFNPDVISRSDDYGLMQINKINHDWLRDKGIDPNTYEGNIEAGIYILSQKINRYGDLTLALMAYNCGDAGAKRLWDAGTYSTAYSRTVMDLYQKWVSVLEGK